MFSPSTPMSPSLLSASLPISLATSLTTHRNASNSGNHARTREIMMVRMIYLCCIAMTDGPRFAFNAGRRVCCRVKFLLTTSLSTHQSHFALSLPSNNTVHNRASDPSKLACRSVITKTLLESWVAVVGPTAPPHLPLSALSLLSSNHLLISFISH